MSALGPSESLFTSSRQQQASRLLKQLNRELLYMVGPEMHFTMTVAILSAAGVSRPEIVRRLDCGDIELRMAFERLKKLASNW